MNKSPVLSETKEWKNLATVTVVPGAPISSGAGSER